MGLLEAGALLLIVKEACYSGVRWITNILFPCPTPDPLMLDLVGSPAFGGVTCRDSNGDSSNLRENVSLHPCHLLWVEHALPLQLGLQNEKCGREQNQPHGVKLSRTQLELAKPQQTRRHLFLINKCWLEAIEFWGVCYLALYSNSWLRHTIIVSNDKTTRNQLGQLCLLYRTRPVGQVLFLKSGPHGSWITMLLSVYYFIPQTSIELNWADHWEYRD